MLQPKPGILNITPYVPGRSKVGSNVTKIIKLSSNEAALGPSPKAIEAYTDHSAKLFRYPDGSAALLREAIGAVYKLDPERIICGTGSDELIALLIQAYAGAGDEVLYSQYGFLMYPISTLKVNGIPVKAPEKNYRTDVDALLASVTERTKIVFVANPNNPTGSYIGRDELLRLRHGLPPHVLLVIDAAYAEYVSEKDYTDGADIVDMGENTVMTRTFSKIYGLASLRLGWAYCPASIVDILNRIRGPFNVPGAAIDAGIAAMHDTAFTTRAREHNDVWKDWLIKELTALDLIVHPSVANFLLVTFPSDASKNAEAANIFLQEQGIIVRDVKAYDLPQCLRITVGTEDESKAVINALQLFMKRRNA